MHIIFYIFFASYTLDKTICTWHKNKDTCNGDSGGPLVLVQGWRVTLVGLTSWGPMVSR